MLIDNVSNVLLQFLRIPGVTQKGEIGVLQVAVYGIPDEQHLALDLTVHSSRSVGDIEAAGQKADPVTLGVLRIKLIECKGSELSLAFGC